MKPVEQQNRKKKEGKLRRREKSPISAPKNRGPKSKRAASLRSQRRKRLYIVRHPAPMFSSKAREGVDA